jgi:DNA topoisomerase IA
MFGEEYIEHHVFAKKSKNAQEAHEAIRPTNLSKDHAGFNEDQKRLYRLIWKRTIASQMKDAKVLRTKLLPKLVMNIPGKKSKEKFLILPLLAAGLFMMAGLKLIRSPRRRC